MIFERQVQYLKITKNLSFPAARRLAAESDGPVTYAAVASRSSHGPRSSPRNSQRQRLQLSPGRHYSKYVSQRSDDLNTSLETVNSEKSEKEESAMDSTLSNSDITSSTGSTQPGQSTGPPVETQKGKGRGTPLKTLSLKTNTSQTTSLFKRKSEHGDKPPPKINRPGYWNSNSNKKK
jgi:hypothetical protein